jgi:cell wall-associated NlpC family hydrolase
VAGGGPAAQQAVKAALTKLGGPYVWGAKGPNNFDCSGLTLWTYCQAGITLGPNTYTQIKDGQQVAPGNVQAGGLIFPKYSWDSRGPGHVQLAISPTEVVRRRPLRQPSWQARHLASSGLHQGVVLGVTVCL